MCVLDNIVFVVVVSFIYLDIGHSIHFSQYNTSHRNTFTVNIHQKRMAYYLMLITVIHETIETIKMEKTFFFNIYKET